MCTGWIEFVAPIGSVEFEEYVINGCSFDGIDRLVLCASKGKFSVKCSVSLRNVDEVCEFVERASKFLVIYVDWLCVYFDDVIGVLELSDYSLMDSNNNKYANIIKRKVSVGMSWAVFGRKKIYKARIESVHELSERAKVLCGLYRSCIGIRDSVHRYVMLYHILLIEAEDRQSVADDIIQKFRPDVKYFEFKRNNRKYRETFFTKLRNEIAHKRQNCVYEETCKEIVVAVDDLRAIVRDLIIQKYGIAC